MFLSSECRLRGKHVSPVNLPVQERGSTTKLRSHVLQRSVKRQRRGHVLAIEMALLLSKVPTVLARMCIFNHFLHFARFPVFVAICGRGNHHSHSHLCTLRSLTTTMTTTTTEIHFVKRGNLQWHPKG
jgi:hypothetical protein